MARERRLLNGLGKICDDSVFARAFYVYGIGNLINYNKKVNKRIFTNDEIHQAFKAVLKCFNDEADLRDYVSIKGWAHAIAHYGDNLGTFAEDDAIEHADLMDILIAIRSKICINNHQYRGGEDERLAAVIIKTLERGLISEEEFSSWLASFLDLDNELNALYYNRVNFLWSIKFNLKNDLRAKYWNCVSDVIIKMLELV